MVFLMRSEQTFPQTVERFPFEIWLFNRRLKLAEGARLVGVSAQSLEAALLPPEHPRFRAASLNVRKKIKAFTAGEISMDDWPEALEDCGRGGVPVRKSRARGLPAVRGATAPSGARSAQPEGASLQGVGQ